LLPFREGEDGSYEADTGLRQCSQEEEEECFRFSVPKEQTEKQEQRQIIGIGTFE
jgi:hypothetical protein